MAEYQNGGSFTFEAFDKDIASSDLLGSTDPLDLVDIVQHDSQREWTLDIYEEKGAHAGTLKLTTELVSIKPDPPILENINYNC